jgi:hypothetical protein
MYRLAVLPSMPVHEVTIIELSQAMEVMSDRPDRVPHTI